MLTGRSACAPAVASAPPKGRELHVGRAASTAPTKLERASARTAAASDGCPPGDSPRHIAAAPPDPTEVGRLGLGPWR